MDMARARKRIHGKVKISKQTLWPVAALAVIGLSLGVFLHISRRDNDAESAQGEAPTHVATPQPLPRPQPEETPQEPQNADEPQPLPPDDETEPEPLQSHDTLEPEPTPETDPDTPEPEEEPDTDTPDQEEPAEPQDDTPTEPTDPPAPAEPTPANDTKPEEPTPPQQPRQELPNPYRGDYTLMGTGAIPKQWQSLVGRLATEGQVQLFAQALEEKIEECLPSIFTAHGLNQSLYQRNKALMYAAEFCYLVRCVGAEKLEAMFFPKVGEPDPRTSGASFLAWALADKDLPLHHLMQEFKINHGDPKDLAYTIQMLYTIWKSEEDIRNRSRYLNLALACALVKKDIAEGKGKLRDPHDPLLTMPEIYAYLVKRDRRQSLRANLEKLSVSQLLYVVDPRLPQSEYDWTHRKVRYARDKWGEAYESIEYLMENAIDGTDKYRYYTLEEIQDEGGICADRAYFCATTAKTVGIPAAILVGDGDRGPHAWVAYMPNDKSWTTVGSYGYSTGYYINPCSGKKQHESTLAPVDEKWRDEKLLPATDIMVLADYLLHSERHREAQAAAAAVCRVYPKFIEGWRNRVELMEKLHENGLLNAKSWENLANEIERTSGKTPELLDIAQEVQVKHLLPKQRDVTKLTILKKGHKRLMKTSTNRIELVIRSLERQGQVYGDAKRYHELDRMYKKLLEEYATQNYFFECLLRHYCSFLEEKNDVKMWKSIAKDAETLFAKQIYQSEDFFRTKKEADIMCYIADLYEKAGDEKKALRIKKEAEKKLREIADREKKLNKPRKR